MTPNAQRFTRGRATVAGVSLVAIVMLSACSYADAPSAAAAQSSAAPMLVNCGAGQQPLIRQVALDGALVPQLECVAVAPATPVAASGTPTQVQAPLAAAQPIYYAPAPLAAPAYAYTPAPAAEPMVLRQPRAAARPVSTRPVYDDDVIEYRTPQRNRSWQKSAVIIGSSAGVGAGVGAAAGGKKGALIGAAIGGGSATVWDQATRRR